MSFPVGNSFKYVFRHKEKNGRQDLKKALWYLDKTAAGIPNVRCRYGLESVLDELEGVALSQDTIQLRVLWRLARLDAYGSINDWKLAYAGIKELLESA
jgi:hypothetical protein